MQKLQLKLRLLRLAQEVHTPLQRTRLCASEAAACASSKTAVRPLPCSWIAQPNARVRSSIKSTLVPVLRCNQPSEDKSGNYTGGCASSKYKRPPGYHLYSDAQAPLPYAKPTYACRVVFDQGILQSSRRSWELCSFDRSTLTTNDIAS